MRLHSHIRHDRRHRHQRGSVLLVVIGLLGMLLLVGIAFYTFAAQESSSGEFYSESAKEPIIAEMDADALFNFALEQLIVGPEDSLGHSALRGGRQLATRDASGNLLQMGFPGRHSILAGIIGRDTTLYNGLGIRLSTDGSGNPQVDMNLDGTADNPSFGDRLNFSAAANSGTAPDVLALNLPDPDTGYTSPDINSPYLSYESFTYDLTNTRDIAVLKPSFHFPQIVRGDATTLTAGGSVDMIFRPHPDHTVVGNPGVRRFLSAATPHPTIAGRTVAAFPFYTGGDGNPISQGVWELGSAPAAGYVPVYNWDADNDGDGIFEGIWMDLDHPVQELADGRMFVPMFSFTVIDGDGLINLNSSGNITSWYPPDGGVAPANPTGPPLVNVGGTAYAGNVAGFVHRSNQGLSRSEINPQWGLYADGSVPPIAAPQQVYFNADGTWVLERNKALLNSYRITWNLTGAADTISRVDTSNMDLLNLLLGRAQFQSANAPNPGGYYASMGTGYAPQFYFPGRRTGEIPLGLFPSEVGLWKNLLAPSTTTLTSTSFTLAALSQPGDKYDNPATGSINETDDDFDSGYGGIFTSYVHPLDYYGAGSTLTIAPMSEGLQQQGVTRDDDISANPTRWPFYYRYTSPTVNVPQLRNSYVGSGTYLHNNGGNEVAGVIDEEDETLVESRSANLASIADSIFGAEENYSLQVSDNLYNASTDPARLRNLMPFNFAANKQRRAIRKQYTVTSFDRKQFSLPLNIVRSPLEVNRDTDNDGNFEFPPASITALGTDPAEPFRAPLRNWLLTEFSEQGNGQTIPQALNPNGIVDFNPANGNLIFRPLTEHSSDPGTADVSSIAISALVPPTSLYPPNNAAWSADMREAWARYDRQRLARDIYVLLYSMGGGAEGVEYLSPGADANAYTAAPDRNLYSDEQLREMAQFAVNVVDAMDGDNVITRFEYDRNLGDGWGLDDNAYTNSGDTITDAMMGDQDDRGVVYGVELQQLAFSEGLVIHTPALMADRTDVTTYDDTIERFFTFLELRNMAPTNVDFDNDAWRLRIVDNNVLNEKVVHFTGGDVPHGRQLMVKTRLGSDLAGGMERASDFRVNYDYSANQEFNTIAPYYRRSFSAPTPAVIENSGSLPAIPTNMVEMDLVRPDLSSSNFTASVTDNGGTGIAAGDWITGAGTDVVFVIERRQHLTRDNGASVADNPWVEVDRMVVPVREFSLTSGTTETALWDAGTMGGILTSLTSVERIEPMRRNPVAEPIASNPNGAEGYIQNSIGDTRNFNSPSEFNWQAHFDRPFASVMDLLSIPLVGPHQATLMGNGPTWSTPAYFAQERFLRPQHPSNIGAMVPNTLLDNRWYRVLGLLTVPTQTNLSVSRYPYNQRTPGALNLNTIRHRAVLAGLIDDYAPIFSGSTTPSAMGGHLNPLGAYSFNYPAMLADTAADVTDGATRDWWYQFVTARDGADPVTGLPLPGMAHSRPFRSLNFSDRNTDSINDTILRGLPKDGIATGARGLFEASRNYNTATAAIDQHTRHRLLRKVANNSTTRSNVFHVFISVGYFEAIRHTNGDVQIGGQLPGTQIQRGFFVIDRSLPELGFDSSSGQFDYRKFIEYRKTIR